MSFKPRAYCSECGRELKRVSGRWDVWIECPDHKMSTQDVVYEETDPMSQRTLGDAKAQERMDEVVEVTINGLPQGVMPRGIAEAIKKIADTDRNQRVALQGLADALVRYSEAYKDPQFVSQFDRERQAQARAALDTAKPFLKGATDGNQ